MLWFLKQRLHRSILGNFMSNIEQAITKFVETLTTILNSSNHGVQDLVITGKAIAPDVWAGLIYQTRLSAIISITVSLLIVLLCIYLVIQFMKLYQKSGEEETEDIEGEPKNEDYLIASLVVAVVAAVLLVWPVVNNLIIIINPEYYAAKEVLSEVRNLLGAIKG